MPGISEYARGLRLYAEWLEEVGDRLLELFPYLSSGHAIGCVSVDTRDELVAVAALMGVIDRVEEDEHFDPTDAETGIHNISFYRDFGPGVSFYVFGRCKDLCDHVIHEKLVPVKTVKWCPPPILEATTPVAA